MRERLAIGFGTQSKSLRNAISEPRKSKMVTVV